MDREATDNYIIEKELSTKGARMLGRQTAIAVEGLLTSDTNSQIESAQKAG